MKTKRGFTLVEVLVAMLIMAVLAGMAWQGIDGISRARDAGQQRSERSLRLNTVLAQWELDLQSIHETRDAPALSFDGSTVRLIRQTAGGAQVVAWSLRERHWQRWAGPSSTRGAQLQESWLRSQQLLGSEAAQLRTLSGVSAVQLYFWRGGAWSNAQSSGDVAAAPAPSGSAPGRTRELLPQGVRLVLAFEGELNGNLTRDTMLAPSLP